LKLILNYNDTQIKTAIKNSKEGLDKYKKIMELFPEIDVSKDISFQRSYIGFYRLRLSKDFINIYFSFFQKHKNNHPTFIDTLGYFYNEFKSLQCSFTSKLLATLDPNLPIWDQNVLGLFNLRNPGNWLLRDERIKKADKIYNELINWYNIFITSEEGRRWIKLFDEKYNKSNITSTKKIDFILWQLGKDN